MIPKFLKTAMDCMIVLVAVALIVIVGNKIQEMQFVPQQLPTISIPAETPCPTEDSDNCFWDADVQGNGLGTDVISK